jgi:hypothetical protein
MPVAITSTAVTADSPPRPSDTAMAMPAVTDFGASETSIGRGSPSARPIATTETTATIEPTASADPIGTRLLRTTGQCRYKGTASATVAGPSRKCTNWAPWK